MKIGPVEVVRAISEISVIQTSRRSILNVSVIMRYELIQQYKIKTEGKYESEVAALVYN